MSASENRRRGGKKILIDLKQIFLNDHGYYYCSVNVSLSSGGHAEALDYTKTDECRTFTNSPTFERRQFEFNVQENAEGLDFEVPIRVYRAERDKPEQFELYAFHKAHVDVGKLSQTSIQNDDKTMEIHRRVFLTRNIADSGVSQHMGKMEISVTVEDQTSPDMPSRTLPLVQSRIQANAESSSSRTDVESRAFTNPQRYRDLAARSTTILGDQDSRLSTPGIDLPDPAGIPVFLHDVAEPERQTRSQLEPSPSPTSLPLSSIRGIHNTATHSGMGGYLLETVPETPLSFDEDPVNEQTSAYQESLHTEKRHQMPSASQQFPSSNAVVNILPHYLSLSQQYGDMSTGSNRNTSEYKPLEIPPDTPLPSHRSPAMKQAHIDETSMIVIERLTKELEDYRLGVQKMGGDIVQLRETIARLEQDKMFLKQEVADQEQASQALVSDSELDSLDRVDLIRKHVRLCQQFGAEVKRSRDYRERVQTLQNEVIRKNEKEKGLLKIQQAHTAQQNLVQKLQDRLQRSQRYKETCRQQEKVINQLEELIAKNVQNNSVGRPSDSSSVIDLLRKENSDLRASLLAYEDIESTGNELKVVRFGPTAGQTSEVTILQQKLEEEEQKSAKLEEELKQAGQGLSAGDDKWDVEQKLERAEERIQSLEASLTENAKSFAREKAHLELYISDLKAQMNAVKNSSHALTHSGLVHVPSLPYAALPQDSAGRLESKPNPLYGRAFDVYGGVLGQQPLGNHRQPVYHQPTGSLRRPSPRLRPLTPPGQGEVT